MEGAPPLLGCPQAVPNPAKKDGLAQHCLELLRQKGFEKQEKGQSRKYAINNFWTKNNLWLLG